MLFIAIDFNDGEFGTHRKLDRVPPVFVEEPVDPAYESESDNAVVEMVELKLFADRFLSCYYGSWCYAVSPCHKISSKVGLRIDL